MPEPHWEMVEMERLVRGFVGGGVAAELWGVMGVVLMREPFVVQLSCDGRLVTVISWKCSIRLMLGRMDEFLKWYELRLFRG